VEHRLDPGIRVVWLVGSLALASIPLIATAIAWFVGVPGWLVAIGGAVSAVAVLGAVTTPFARYRRWSYALRPGDLVVRHGVVTETERWIPRTRVQYVDLSQGPIDRVLGLRTLVVYTAGSGLRAVSIPGLPAGTAESLRSDLLGVKPADDGPAA
jgi:membrane protein YdbS with pleckstrin-like domain